MGEAAVACAKAIGYVGAGTVEFIAADSFARDGAFYFMEMNTRLQVEHPVTEMITGRGPRRMAAARRGGRAAAEAAGRARASRPRDRGAHLRRGSGPRLPAVDRHARRTCARRRPAPAVRVDTGVRAGDEISPYYDPMIAKLIVHGEDRPAALRRLAEALAEYEIVGVATNVAFLRARRRARGVRVRQRRHRAHRAPPGGAVSRRRRPSPTTRCSPRRSPRRGRSSRERAAAARASGDPHSPWHAVDPWWANSARHAIVVHVRRRRGAARRRACAATATAGA